MSFESRARIRLSQPCISLIQLQYRGPSATCVSARCEWAFSRQGKFCSGRCTWCWPASKRCSWAVNIGDAKTCDCQMKILLPAALALALALNVAGASTKGNPGAEQNNWPWTARQTRLWLNWWWWEDGVVGRWGVWVVAMMTPRTIVLPECMANACGTEALNAFYKVSQWASC